MLAFYFVGLSLPYKKKRQRPYSEISRGQPNQIINGQHMEQRHQLAHNPVAFIFQGLLQVDLGGTAAQCCASANAAHLLELT